LDRAHYAHIYRRSVGFSCSICFKNQYIFVFTTVSGVVVAVVVVVGVASSFTITSSHDSTTRASRDSVVDME